MYHGFSNYATWAIFNYISNHEDDYNRYYMMCKRISTRATNPDLYELSNALKDDFKKRGIIDINETEKSGLYADILEDALSEINFLEVAEAFYLPFSQNDK